MDQNLERLLAAMRQGADRGAELLITPECVLDGYGLDEVGGAAERTAALAQPLDGKYVTAVRRLAGELQVDVVLGFSEQAEAGKIYNSAAFIGRAGEILWVYRKIHCRNFERLDGTGCFTTGRQFHVARRPYRQGECHVGAMICFDREITESVRCLRSMRAQFVACPLATDTFGFAGGTRADNEMITRCRAAENEVCIAVVNHAGRFNGGSYVVGPEGEVICALGPAAEVGVVDVPVGLAAKLHADPYGWMGWGYRQPPVYRENCSDGE